MGMYTELVCAFDLKKDVPKSVIDILNYMISPTESRPNFSIPDHPLFSTARWDFMLCSSSFYFPGRSLSQLVYDTISGYSLTIRSNLKNYDNEIEKFIDWIQPYMKTHGFFGYVRYEEDEEQILLYNE